MSLTPSLPNAENLLGEQYNFLDLLKLGNYSGHLVVEGGPGTGKSVVAALRALEVAGNDKRVLLLFFNRPVREYMLHALRKKPVNWDVDNFVKTCHSWLYSKSDFLKKSYPKPYEISLPLVDWESVHRDLSYSLKVGKILPYDEIIVDEAQDIPLGFFKCLKLVTKRIICFIDPAQAIGPFKLDVKSLENELGDFENIEFKVNYRNPPQIIEAATVFSGGDVPYSRAANNSRPVVWDCGNDFAKVIYNISCIVKKYYREKSIGIIVSPNSTAQCPVMNKCYLSLLEELRKDPYSEKFRVLCNDGSKNKDKDVFKDFFSKGGVKIFTFNTVKGLEFDIVILLVDPLLHRNNYSLDKEYKSKLYVAMTRAKEKCYLLYKSGLDYRKDFSYDVLPLLKEHSRKFDWWGSDKHY